MKIGFDLFVLLFAFLLSTYEKTVTTSIFLFAAGLYVTGKYAIKIMKRKK